MMKTKIITDVTCTVVNMVVAYMNYRFKRHRVEPQSTFFLLAFGVSIFLLYINTVLFSVHCPCYYQYV